MMCDHLWKSQNWKWDLNPGLSSHITQVHCFTIWANGALLEKVVQFAWSGESCDGMISAQGIFCPDTGNRKKSCEKGLFASWRPSWWPSYFMAAFFVATVLGFLVAFLPATVLGFFVAFLLHGSILGSNSAGLLTSWRPSWQQQCCVSLWPSQYFNEMSCSYNYIMKSALV